MWSILLGLVTFIIVIVTENTPAGALTDLKPDDNPDIVLNTVRYEALIM